MTEDSRDPDSSAEETEQIATASPEPGRPSRARFPAQRPIRPTPPPAPDPAPISFPAPGARPSPDPASRSGFDPAAADPPVPWPAAGKPADHITEPLTFGPGGASAGPWTADSPVGETAASPPPEGSPSQDPGSPWYTGVPLGRPLNPAADADPWTDEFPDTWYTGVALGGGTGAQPEPGPVHGGPPVIPPGSPDPSSSSPAPVGPTGWENADPFGMPARPTSDPYVRAPGEAASREMPDSARSDSPPAPAEDAAAFDLSGPIDPIYAGYEDADANPYAPPGGSPNLYVPSATAGDGPDPFAASNPARGESGPYAESRSAGGGLDPYSATGWAGGAPEPSRAAGPHPGSASPAAVDPFGFPAVSRRIEPTPPPPPRSRLLLGVAIGTLIGLLLFGTAGWFTGRATAPKTTAPKTTAEKTTAPKSAPGLFEQTQATLNRQDFAGTRLTAVAQSWLPYLTTCGRTSNPGTAGEKTRVRCTAGGMSAIFVEFDSVAERDKARGRTLRQADDAQRLTPGRSAPTGQRVTPSGTITGNYVEYAYELTEGGVKRTVAGIWWDDAQTPIAAYLLAYWKDSLNERWEPMRDLWSRYA